MMNDKAALVLSRLELGFRTDSAQLKELEKDLTVTLQSARSFGRNHGSTHEWNQNWHQQWDHVEEILSRSRAFVHEMDQSIENCDCERLQKVLKAWDAFESEDAKLLEAFTAIRAQASGLDAVGRRDWNILARTLDAQSETLHTRAQALRIKLELRKKHSKEEVDHLVQRILSKLPNRTHAEGKDAELSEQEYRRAANELEQEKHEYLGFMDVVKSLLIWIETPEERVRRNRSLQVNEV